MRPAASRIGEMVTETSTGRLPLARRIVSKAATALPSTMSSRMRISSSRRSGGMSTRTDRPTTSSAAYPKSALAAPFQLVIRPSSVLPMIASLDDSTIAANRRASSSARLTRVMSFMTTSTPRTAPSSPLVRSALTSTGVRLPSRATAMTRWAVRTV